MKLTWSNESKLHLSEIEEYIAQYNPVNATQFIDDIISEAQLIQENPDLGRAVPEFERIDIRELLFKGYRIVYKKDLSGIIILTVFEGHRKIRKSEIFND